MPLEARAPPKNPSPHATPRQDAHQSHDLHARVKLWIPGNANAAALQDSSGSYDLTVSRLHCKISTASPQERRGKDRCGMWNAGSRYRGLYTLLTVWRQAGRYQINGSGITECRG